MKTYYRIELFNGANTACEAAAKAAAYVNGGQYNLDIWGIAKMADAEKCPDTSIEVLYDGCLLHIDRKIGDEYITVCQIEKVEIMELPKESNPDEDIEENVVLNLHGIGNYLAD